MPSLASTVLFFTSFTKNHIKLCFTILVNKQKSTQKINLNNLIVGD